MKKILTAMGNPKINEKLKKHFNVINKDIFYKEGILDILKKEKEINLILIYENLAGDISIENLIKKIKEINEKVDIIFFLKEENIEKEKLLKKLKIEKIIYLNKFEFNYLFKLINNKKINNKKKEYKKNIILITCYKKTGKTFLLKKIFNYLIKKNKNILIINFNLKNNIILKTFNSKNKKIKTIKIKNNSKKEIKTILNKYKIYDYIFIEENCFSVTPYILNKTNKVIYVLEGKRLGIKELNNFIKKHKKTLNKNKISLHIVENKYRKKSISNLIIKEYLRKNNIKIQYIFKFRKNKYLKNKILNKINFKLLIILNNKNNISKLIKKIKINKLNNKDNLILKINKLKNKYIKNEFFNKLTL